MNGDIAVMKSVSNMERLGGPPGEMTDDELVSASQRDPSTFGSLYQRYHGPVYDFVLRRVGDAHRAEDITSQVFERALKALPAYRAQVGPPSFRAWLFTIARNAVTDSYRRMRLQLPAEQLAAVPDSQPSPVDHAIAAEATEELRRMLGSLTGRQRRIVELRLAGFSGQEIANELGMSLAAMKSAQYRAFAKIRDLMTDPWHNDIPGTSRHRPRNEP